MIGWGRAYAPYTPIALRSERTFGFTYLFFLFTATLL